MLNRKIYSLFLFFLALSCIKLSHAQTTGSSPSAEQTLNSVLGSVRPAAGTNTSNTSLGEIGQPGKYEEYQSICRMNEYDRISDFPEALKEKRVNFLKGKIKSAKEEDVARIELRLLKEYIDQENEEEQTPLITTLKAKKLSTNNNELLNALIAFATGNFNSARDTLNKILKKEPENIEALAFLAQVYQELGNFFESSTIYEDLNKLTKNAYLVQLCENTVLNLMNVDGEKICNRAATKFPDSPVPHIFIGISWREREDVPKAIEAFKKAISIKPTEMGSTCLGEAYFMKEKFDLSIDQFRKSLEVNPDSMRALLGMAWTYLKIRKYPESLEAFKKACLMNAKNQSELRKAFKVLSGEKIPEARKFIKLAEDCGSN